MTADAKAGTLPGLPAFLRFRPMAVHGRRKTVAFFILFGSCCVALALALNVGWILINWRAVVPLVLGAVFFPAIIAGLVLNTAFLVREIRRNEQHDAFINAVTHELKTPVASIRLYLDTLQSRDLSDEQRRRFYDVMLADSDRLTHTIEQVLAAGKVSRKKRDIHRLPIDLTEMVGECLHLARTRHNLPAEALTLSSAPQRTTVLGDLEELKRAVLNLLDNAIKYSGPQVNVQVAVEPAGPSQVAVRIRDHGIGIPKDQLKRLFRRFYRVPGAMTARVKGTGLGLFIVRSVAEQHGGKAFAESEGAGRGSTFTLELPLAPQER